MCESVGRASDFASGISKCKWDLNAETWLACALRAPVCDTLRNKPGCLKRLLTFIEMLPNGLFYSRVALIAMKTKQNNNNNNKKPKTFHCLFLSTTSFSALQLSKLPRLSCIFRDLECSLTLHIKLRENYLSVISNPCRSLPSQVFKIFQFH